MSLSNPLTLGISSTFQVTLVVRCYVLCIFVGSLPPPYSYYQSLPTTMSHFFSESSRQTLGRSALGGEARTCREAEGAGVTETTSVFVLCVEGRTGVADAKSYSIKHRLVEQRRVSFRAAGRGYNCVLSMEASQQGRELCDIPLTSLCTENISLGTCRERM